MVNPRFAVFQGVYVVRHNAIVQDVVVHVIVTDKYVGCDAKGIPQKRTEITYRLQNDFPNEVKEAKVFESPTDAAMSLVYDMY
jgi:hypothetical protein